MASKKKRSSRRPLATFQPTGIVLTFPNYARAREAEEMIQDAHNLKTLFGPGDRSLTVFGVRAVTPALKKTLADVDSTYTVHAPSAMSAQTRRWVETEVLGDPGDPVKIPGRRAPKRSSRRGSRARA